jgi:hypothetical protein
MLRRKVVLKNGGYDLQCTRRIVVVVFVSWSAMSICGDIAMWKLPAAQYEHVLTHQHCFACFSAGVVVLVQHAKLLHFQCIYHHCSSNCFEPCLLVSAMPPDHHAEMLLHAGLAVGLWPQRHFQQRSSADRGGRTVDEAFQGLG